MKSDVKNLILGTLAITSPIWIGYVMTEGYASLKILRQQAENESSYDFLTQMISVLLFSWEVMMLISAIAAMVVFYRAASQSFFFAFFMMIVYVFPISVFNFLIASNVAMGEVKEKAIHHSELRKKNYR